MITLGTVLRSPHIFSRFCSKQLISRTVGQFFDSQHVGFAFYIYDATPSTGLTFDHLMIFRCT